LFYISLANFFGGDLIRDNSSPGALIYFHVFEKLTTTL